MTRFLMHTVGVLLALALLSGSAAAKVQSAVTATWRGAPASTPLGGLVDVVLHLEASADATVTVALAPTAGVEIVSAGGPWTTAMTAGQTLDLPVTVRFTGNGDSTLGARLGIRRAFGSGGVAIQSARQDVDELGGAVLNAVAVNGTVALGRDSHALMKMAAATTAEELRRLGIAQEPVGGALMRGTASQALPLVTATVTGTVQWLDPEGRGHPVRRAFTVITSGVTGAVLAQIATNDSGVYSASVTADSVQVTVYSRDFDDTRAVVFPLGQPTQRYILQSAVTPLAGGVATININSAATVRGTPGAPSNDSIAARGFAAYDAMLTFWFQATAILGRDMQRAVTNFGGNPPCGTSCYSSSTQQMYILREDAFDWDVLGHEFFHFTTNRGAVRVIDTSPGGNHSGGTAIGQDDGTGHLRTRDEGMRLAWSEGLATFMSLAIQQSPPSTYPFPGTLLNIADSRYSDTEDASLTILPEAPTPNDGFGSENSVLGVLWDLYDTAQDADGDVTDGYSGGNPKLIWDAINSILACSPCDRVDRFWSSIASLFGTTNSSTLGIAKLFVINKMAPKGTAPADGAGVGGTVAPTFQWTRNGDPSASHRNNKFFLIFSRDDFQRHVVTIPVPTLDATTYTPTDPEWASVQAGGSPGDTYKWMIAGQRSDAPVIPAGNLWAGNVRSLVPRTLEDQISWTPLGGDVDLHLANPSGTDIAYYNTSTFWGFLDRDCITTCTQEIISVTSLPLHGTYRLFAHYYDDHGRGPATVHAIVRSGSQTIVDTTFVLSATNATFTIVTTTAKPDDNSGPPENDRSSEVNVLPPKNPEP